MLKHKGTQTIETERLILRRAVPEDAQAMFDNWASDPEVTKFLTWPAYSSADIAKERIGIWIREYEQEDCYQWMIVLRELGQPIGSIGVVDLDEQAKQAEIGYCTGKKWWHQGIMTEALDAVLDYLFHQVGMDRLIARHDIHNPHSGAVMRKCGMEYVGRELQAGRNNQGICDMDCYAKSRPQQHFMEGFVADSDEELVQEIYRRFGEDQRLSKSQSARVEFLTTVMYIERYLKPGARILDVGAGTGVYSFYFAEQGYDVSALELADSNVAAFRAKLTEAHSIDLAQGNAMDLSRYGDNSFDVVLLFGPLYHLHSDEDKLRCIEEAKRVCKPGGKLFFAFISNDIVILTMQQAHRNYLLEGDYNKDTFRLDDFPFVFHTVDRCRQLLDRGGIRILHEVASDGVSELLETLINDMDETTYRQYLRYHFYLCEKPEHLGMSNHLLFIGDFSE